MYEIPSTREIIIFLFNFILNHYILIFLLAKTVFAICYITVIFIL